MGGPAWLAYIFAAIMLTVAGYCAARLGAARWWRRPTDLDADGAHVFMGVAMAGMLVGGLRFLPAGLWEGVFGAGAVWFGSQAVRVRRGAPISQWRCPQPVPHLVECGAMLYMLAAIPVLKSASGGSGMSGMGAGTTPTESRFSLLALALALFLFGWAVWVIDRLMVRTPALAVAVPASAVPVASGPQASGMAMAVGGPAADATEASTAVSSVSSVSSAGCGGEGKLGGYLAPRCAAMCKVAMGITMGYMLVLML
jgi:hypothetical protein